MDDDNDGDFFVAGGQNIKKVFIHSGNQWHEMTDMSTVRRGKEPSLEIENELICLKPFITGHMCGAVRASPGGRVEKIVVAGGYSGFRSYPGWIYHDDVEIFDLTGKTWATGR